MLPAAHRLSSRREITATLRRGRRRASRLLIVHVDSSAVGAPEGRGDRPARAAFAVSGAVGNSVIRHRLTRQLRAVSLPLLDRLAPGTDIVVRALPAARGASFADLTADLEHCLRSELTPPREPGDTGLPTESATESATDSAVGLAVDGEAPGSAGRTGVARVLFVLGSPLRWLLIGAVWAYRQVISPILPPTCRYHPSCSAYALEALQVHGAAKGFVLAVARVARCNPFTKGGLDPVPARGAWRPPIAPDGTPRHPDGAPRRGIAVGFPDDRGALFSARSPQP